VAVEARAPAASVAIDAAMSQVSLADATLSRLLWMTGAGAPECPQVNISVLC
jgi:hypothetical protein